MSDDETVLVDEDDRLRGLDKLEEILLADKTTDERLEELSFSDAFIPTVGLIPWTPPIDVGSLSGKPRPVLDNVEGHLVVPCLCSAQQPYSESLSAHGLSSVLVDGVHRLVTPVIARDWELCKDGSIPSSRIELRSGWALERCLGEDAFWTIFTSTSKERPQRIEEFYEQHIQTVSQTKPTVMATHLDGTWTIRLDYIEHPYPGTTAHFEDRRYPERIVQARCVRTSDVRGTDHLINMTSRMVLSGQSLEFDSEGDGDDNGFAGADLCARVGQEQVLPPPPLTNKHEAIASFKRALTTWYEGCRGDDNVNSDIVLAAYLVELSGAVSTLENHDRLRIVQAVARLPWRRLARRLVRLMIDGDWDAVRGKSFEIAAAADVTDS